MSEEDETKEHPQMKMEMKIRPDIAATPEIESIEIIELLGKGGMSLVYKARQKQLDRIVAVKVLSKLAVRGENGIKRFQKEAKLTSALEHPNIVKTISFGVSKDGQPYLVMEFLEGLSLADDLKQCGRLKLQRFKDVFLPALSALNQAHQAGMVHRDIKPGNIMICRTDTGAETVKLVDFGIAKVFDEGENQTQNLTEPGAVMGSPTYMSPEQCLGKPLDGRSDLYSMACVMYETLSGEPPFSGDSVLEVMQKHSTEPPPTVSDLSRKLDIRKELAQVTLWGLAKDPAARPQTASEFAKKLNEVLERITLDKVPKLKSTSGTLIQPPIAIAVVMLCLLISGFIAYLNQQMHSKGQNELKTLTLNRPRTEEQRYEELMAKSFKTSELTEQIEQLALQCERKSKWALAENLLKRSIELNEKLLGAKHLKLSGSLIGLAHCYYQQEKDTEAEPLYKRALQIREQSLESTNPAVIEALAFLENCYKREGKNAEEEALLRRKLAALEKTLDPTHPLLLDCLGQLGQCCARQKRFAEAERLFRRSLSIAKKGLKQNDPHLLESFYDLATCTYNQGKNKEAAALCREALETHKKYFRSNDVNVTNTMELLAACYDRQGYYTKAQTLRKKTLSIEEQLYGADNPRLSGVLEALADCYIEQGQFVEAESILKRILAIKEKELVVDKQGLIRILDTLARCYVKEGKPAEAMPLVKRIKTIQSETKMMKEGSR